VLDPGDEAIVFDPHYVGAFSAVVELASGVPVVIPTRPEDNWNPDPAAVERAITPRTKLMFMLSPGNPTGSIWSRETVQALAEIAERHDLYVVSDELYEKIAFDGHRVTSPASLPGLRERVFTVNGFSKGYGMTGWRVGYVAAPRSLIDAVYKAQNYVSICAPAISQRAALTALTGPQEPFQRMLAELDRRRRFVVGALQGVLGLHARPQDGTFYTLVDARPLMQAKGGAMRRVLEQREAAYQAVSPSQLLSDYLLVAGGVYVSAGGASPATADGWFRVSEADRIEKLQAGLDRLCEALAAV
jgi:aspartate aminotransferase